MNLSVFGYSASVLFPSVVPDLAEAVHNLQSTNPLRQLMGLSTLKFFARLSGYAVDLVPFLLQLGVVDALLAAMTCPREEVRIEALGMPSQSTMLCTCCAVCDVFAACQIYCVYCCGQVFWKFSRGPTITAGYSPRTHSYSATVSHLRYCCYSTVMQISPRVREL